MKTFKSSTWAVEFTGTRAQCIEQAKRFLQNKYEHGDAFTDDAHRYTFRSDDDAGFTIAMSKLTKTVYCASKWNATRAQW